MILKRDFTTNPRCTRGRVRVFRRHGVHLCTLAPDHLLFRWLDPPALQQGARFHFEERIAGKLLKKTVMFTRIEPGSLIEFAPTSRLFRMLLPRISFRIRPANGELTVTQDIQLRIGPLAARLNRRELDAVRRQNPRGGRELETVPGTHLTINSFAHLPNRFFCMMAK